jgi:arylsulfatase A-like enzyme
MSRAPLVRPLLLAVVSLAIGCGEAPAKPPNVLLLYADDWRHDSLGSAGHPVLTTPSLDRLAGEGVRFTHAYVTTAVCGVSRASLFTGQWMSRHGNTGFAMFRTPWAETFPGLLRDRGYWVGHVGKWDNGEFPAEQFDFGRAYGGHHWLKDENGSAVHVTEQNERDALEFLRTRPRAQPFLLTVAFFAPHAEDEDPRQYLPQPRSMALYEDAEMPVPANATEESWRRLPPFFDERNEGRRRWRLRFATPEQYQTMMKNYYRLVHEVDTVVGRLLAELEAEGVLDETLVIFTTDNGYFHGEHGLADKWYPYEESIRVPLIVRHPRTTRSQRGRTNDDVVLNVDVAPSVLAAAGIDAPPRMQGRDFAPLYLGDVRAEWRTEFFYEHPTIFGAHTIPASQALVRKDSKYIRWPEHDMEQLFDLVTDPREQRDLAGDPLQDERLVAQRRRFAELQAAAR